MTVGVGLWFGKALSLLVIGGFLVNSSKGYVSLVWEKKALNTAFEFLADAAAPEFHTLVRNAKDVAAGAVLITAVAAVIIGSIVFWPYVQKLFLRDH